MSNLRVVAVGDDTDKLMWNGLVKGGRASLEVLFGRAEPEVRGLLALWAGDGVPGVNVDRPQRSEDERH